MYLININRHCQFTWLYRSTNVELNQGLLYQPKKGCILRFQSRYTDTTPGHQPNIHRKKDSEEGMLILFGDVDDQALGGRSQGPRRTFETEQRNLRPRRRCRWQTGCRSCHTQLPFFSYLRTLTISFVSLNTIHPYTH